MSFSWYEFASTIDSTTATTTTSNNNTTTTTHNRKNNHNSNSNTTRNDTPSPPTKSFPTKSPRVELYRRLPINFNGHRNSHPLELRVCLSQTSQTL